MAQRHLNVELLERLLAGTTAGREIVEVLLDHRVDDCAECRAAYRALAERRRGAREHRYRAVFTGALERLQQAGLGLRARRSDADRDFAVLLSLAHPQRKERVRRSLSRFRSPELVDRLLDESLRQIRRDPFVAADLAELARAVALRVSAAEVGHALAMTCLVRADAHRGNAARVKGFLQEAEQLLEGALTRFSVEGNGDPLVEAEVLRFLASLRNDQGQPEAALAHLDRAWALCEECGAEDELDRLRVKKAVFLSTVGDYEGAVGVLREGLPSLQRDRDPGLYLCAVHELSRNLVLAGHYPAATALLELNRSVYESSPEAVMRLRHPWLLGMAARGEGRLDVAETLLEGAMTAFEASGLEVHAALAAVDLAAVYLLQGRPGRVRETAERVVAAYSGVELPPEVARALASFLVSARQQCATVDGIAELMRHLQGLRRRTRLPA